MSAERGARPGGGEADDKSQTAAEIAPQGGDVYRAFCYNNRLVRRRKKRATVEKHLDKFDCMRGIVEGVDT
jgi:hypothetical protein